MWEIEYTDEFERWWNTLPQEVQESVAHHVEVLQAVGPGLGRPQVDTVRGSPRGERQWLSARRRSGPR